MVESRWGRGEGEFGVGASKATIGADFGIVAEEDEIGGGRVFA